MIQKIIFATLLGIIIVGIIGIPMGDPKFIVNAIILESSFVVLAFLSVWRIRLAIIPNVVISSVVIIGNTLSPKHIEIMSSMNPLENAIVLIVGGYVMQSILLITDLIALKQKKYLQSSVK